MSFWPQCWVLHQYGVPIFFLFSLSISMDLNIFRDVKGMTQYLFSRCPRLEFSTCSEAPNACTTLYLVVQNPAGLLLVTLSSVLQSLFIQIRRLVPRDPSILDKIHESIRSIRLFKCQCSTSVPKWETLWHRPNYVVTCRVLFVDSKPSSI